MRSSTEREACGSEPVCLEPLLRVERPEVLKREKSCHRAAAAVDDVQVGGLRQRVGPRLLLVLLHALQMREPHLHVRHSMRRQEA